QRPLPCQGERRRRAASPALSRLRILTRRRALSYNSSLRGYPLEPAMKSSLTTLDLLAGGSVGTLLGVLLGLSASPVVAAAVGALGAALLALLDLGERQAGSTAEENAVGAGRRLRVASFAAFCVIATVVALVVRTENVLGISEEPSLRARRDAWVRLGLSEASAPPGAW